MSSAPLSSKLLIREGDRVLVLNAPAGYVHALVPLPDNVHMSTKPEGTFEVVQLFARNQVELGSIAPVALASLKPGGVLWGCYPKGSSGLQTDLSRDQGWDAFTDVGWEVVTAVSIDETWSGSRFRPRAEIRR